MPGYLLVHRYDGKIAATHDHPYADPVNAARLAGRHLMETAGVGSATGRLFAEAMARRPAGTVWGHGSGHDYRILPLDLAKDFTEDQVMIRPGLKVITNELRWGVIDPAQFFDESVLGPGGTAFDHWYYVRYDGEDRPTKRFDSARLATTAPKGTTA